MRSPYAHRAKYGEAILCLEERRAWCLTKAEERPGHDGYYRREAAALKLALSCLDEAWARERNEEEGQ